MTSLSNPHLVRREHPKKQPRQAKVKGDFSQAVKDLVKARAHKLCERDGCGPIEVYHHRRPRGAGGSRLRWVGQPANCLGLANRCHDWIEGKIEGSSREVSTDNGWLVSQHGTVVSADVRVLYRGVWVLLDDEGGITPVGGES